MRQGASEGGIAVVIDVLRASTTIITALAHGARRVRPVLTVDEARARGAGLVQLTTDLRREDARRFYARLGFVGSHLGMKRDLTG